MCRYSIFFVAIVQDWYDSSNSHGSPLKNVAMGLHTITSVGAERWLMVWLALVGDRLENPNLTAIPAMADNDD